MPNPHRTALFSSIPSLAPLCFPTTSLYSPTTVAAVESAAVPSPLVVMSAASSSSSVVRRRALALPLAHCPSCKEKVSMYISTTEKHDGWVFYKCQKNGHWELEYVQYLIDKHYLVSDVLWMCYWSGGGKKGGTAQSTRAYLHEWLNQLEEDSKNESANGLTRQQFVALMTLGRELVTLMKMLVGVVVLLGCVALVLIIFKM
ncbi:hypothetical protein D1007_40578 [Hordeum vulgare]|nr:hypothetical protein D1007_40578 [Hordeum vulgare]